ncbi:MAG TPA: YdhR family protein [Solirubrobacteraceae bacterium]|nr:YdhR family protein [Solirubrobacteraceae bacterium]
MYVQIIEFDAPGLTHAEYAQFCDQAVPAIAEVPGVLGKLFLADPDSSRRAGIYTFTGREAADAYLRSDLFRAAIATNPAIANVRARGSELLERPTRALDDALAAGAGVR